MALVWRCDYCGYEEVQVLDFDLNLPVGWFVEYDQQGWPKKQYHSEACLLATMSEEEREEYKSHPWMG